MTPFRIFVSSPGDVSEERALAERVIVRLAREWPAVPVEPFLWEHEPLLATSAYQDQIDRICRPSDTDVVVCLLWCRFGTRLPKGLTRPDGSPYGSGTEYELEDAAAGHERTRKRPALLLYKRTAKLLVDIEDARYLDRKQQKDDTGARVPAHPRAPGDLRAETCRLVRRNLTEAEWREYVGTADNYSATCPALAQAKGGPHRRRSRTKWVAPDQS